MQIIFQVDCLPATVTPTAIPIVVPEELPPELELEVSFFSVTGASVTMGSGDGLTVTGEGELEASSGDGLRVDSGD
jgi:hypothetical protein